MTGKRLPKGAPGMGGTVREGGRGGGRREAGRVEGGGRAVSVFLDDETGRAGASIAYKGLRGSDRFPGMRLGRKCALIGDWACAETESAGIPAEKPESLDLPGEAARTPGTASLPIKAPVSRQGAQSHRQVALTTARAHVAFRGKDNRYAG
jgi:hypothetical protein